MALNLQKNAPEKERRYPDIGASEAFIREHWLGRRTTDCVGLLKGYGWLNPDTLTIDYNTNGMPDYNADQMYASAAENGTEYGVVRTKVEGRGWQGWCKIPYIQYDE